MGLFSTRTNIMLTGMRPSESQDLQSDPESMSHLVGLAHLWAAQFQQIMNLALAGAGGLLILVQTELVTTSGRWWVALITFVVAALVSMIGQWTVVEEATRGVLPAKAARRMVGLAYMLFGGSLYLLIRIFLEAAAG